MFRSLLPAIIALISAPLAAPLAAQAALRGAACENLPFDTDNCVQVFACIGDDGLFARGEAYGWDQGGLSVLLSSGAQCSGTWTADGPLGTGLARLTCTDGLTADIIYYSQDNATGTTIGRGHDSLGRPVQAWSGANVLEFLSDDGQPINARLPCAPTTLLLS